MRSLWTTLIQLIDSFKYPKCKLCKKNRLIPGVSSSEVLPGTVCVSCWKHERARVRWHNKRSQSRRAGQRVSTRQWMAMLDKHNYGCVQCGKNGRKNLTLDHITSLSDGGHQHIENFQPLCVSCHSLKDGWRANPFYVRFWRKFKKKMIWRWKRIKVYWNG